VLHVRCGTEEIERAVVTPKACQEQDARAEGGQCGAINFVQRFGSLNLHVHFHIALPDGVFTRDPDVRRGAMALGYVAEIDIAMLKRLDVVTGTLVRVIG
jgi:hypothetical protein